MKKQLLFVDDEQLVLDALRRAMHSQRLVWEGTYLSDPLAAWERLQEGGFDAVVADVKMPGLSGLELLDRIQATPQTSEIPVVILTGVSDRELKRRALDLGAADLLSKPIEAEDLLARLRNVLRLKSYQDELKASNRRLERAVQQRTEELFHSRLDIIWRLGKAAEHRDQETVNHVVRVGCISRAVAEVIGLDHHFVETLFLAAPLHDIGKIGIPDAILLKRGSLSPDEWAVMKQHCHIGARILGEDPHIRSAFLQWCGASAQAAGRPFENPFLEMAASIALTHHEKWDGSGYPQELAGEEIPLEARIVAIADVFDALTSWRPYKDARPEHEALEIIAAAEHSHFDPAVYAAFLHALPEIRAIRSQFADNRASASAEVRQTRDEKDLVCR